MAKIKMHLNNSEERENLATARRLQAAGCDISISSGQKLEVTQENTLLSSASVLSHGDVAYIIPVTIVSLHPNFIIRDFDLTFPWPDPGLFFLPNPAENQTTNDVYYLPDGSSFRRQEVLNHRLDNLGKLPAGGITNGILLAVGSAPIPSQYRHGSSVWAKLSITDQFEEAHEEKIELWVNRTECLKHPVPRKRSSSLFEREDGTIRAPQPEPDLNEAALRQTLSRARCQLCG